MHVYILFRKQNILSYKNTNHRFSNSKSSSNIPDHGRVDMNTQMDIFNTLINILIESTNSYNNINNNNNNHQRAIIYNTQRCILLAISMNDYRIYQFIYHHTTFIEAISTDVINKFRVVYNELSINNTSIQQLQLQLYSGYNNSNSNNNKYQGNSSNNNNSSTSNSKSINSRQHRNSVVSSSPSLSSLPMTPLQSPSFLSATPPLMIPSSSFLSHAYRSPAKSSSTAEHNSVSGGKMIQDFSSFRAVDVDASAQMTSIQV